MSLTRTEYAVLGLLAWSGGERSGYELRQSAERSIGFVWAPTRSQLYAVLPRLAAAGLTRTRHVAQSTRPDKQLHAITDAGRAELHAWIDEVEAFAPDDRDGLLLKLFFAAHGPPGAAERQLADFRARVAERLAVYERIEAEILADEDPDPHPLMTLRLGIGLSRATIDWADATLPSLRGLRARG